MLSVEQETTLKTSAVKAGSGVAVLLAVSTLAWLWIYSKVSSAVENRASLHLDSVHTLNFSGVGEMPIVEGYPPSPQDVANFQEWLNPDQINLSEVWSLGSTDIHPPLYTTLVHLLRVAGLDFKTAFLAVNMLGSILLMIGICITCFKDQRSSLKVCSALLFVTLTPATFAASQEARQWVLFAGLSMLSMSFLATVTVSNLRGETIGKRHLALIIVSVVVTLLVETSFVLGLLAWAVSSQVLAFPRNRFQHQSKVSLQIAIPVIGLWLVLSPGTLGHFRGATSLRSQGDSTWSLFVPRLNTEISVWFLRRMGDLWQMGGDRRVTYVLLIVSSILLLLSQLRTGILSKGSSSGGTSRKVPTHGFIIGLVGTVWTLFYFALFSLEYLPTYAVGFKYVLPFGVLLLFGIFDGVSALRAGVLGAMLLAMVMIYHANALDLPGQRQGALVSEMLAADGIAVVGAQWDVANIMYAISEVDESSSPDVLWFRSPARWREGICAAFPDDARVAVYVDRPPWGDGLSELFDGWELASEKRVLGELEFGEVAVVSACTRQRTG